MSHTTNEIKWSIGFIGGHFTLTYNEDTQTVEIWECLKNGSRTQIAAIEVDYSDIGERELSLMGQAFIQGLSTAENLDSDLSELEPDFENYLQEKQALITEFVSNGMDALEAEYEADEMAWALICDTEV